MCHGDTFFIFGIDFSKNNEYNISRKNPTFLTFKEVFMVTNNFIDNAKVMSKGQVTIPKDVRDILGIESGDRVTFIVENGNVRIVNSAIYAMQVFQKNMEGEAEKSGLNNDDDVMQLVEELRSEN